MARQLLGLNATIYATLQSHFYLESPEIDSCYKLLFHHFETCRKARHLSFKEFLPHGSNLVFNYLSNSHFILCMTIELLKNHTFPYLHENHNP